ncbi:VWA domain-containing protein [Portibacter marinus]|uniref:VWA domain-containing protein n=1 Tax=Portibacter marinus TaxID=2898660 RepID=UPI001F42CED5|nr:VWA domain-containing protein [Portibacter marinus]
MKSYAYLLIALFIVATSCQKDFSNVEIPPLGCTEDLSENSFEITIQDKFVELPGKVSVFFKVDRKDGKPVAKLRNNDFSVYEKGKNDDCFKTISAFESNARISPNQQIFKYSTMLVLDLSGSVLQGSFYELKNATKQFIQSIIYRNDDATEIGIWWFDGEDKLHELQDFTENTSLLLSKVDKLDPNMSNDPSTDLYGAVLKSTVIADDHLAGYLNKGTIAASSVVVFTDGTDQAARHSKDEAIRAVKSSDASINYFTIGLGNEIDTKVLSALGPAGTIIADSNQDLEEKFKETADLVFDEANSYYLFEYCSPKRDGSGVNELVLQVSSDGLKGYAKTEFDATSFESGCN